MCRERQGHALVASQEFIVIQVRQLERLGEYDRIPLDTVRAVHEIGRIELKKPLVELAAAASLCGTFITFIRNRTTGGE